ncbi:putative Kinesin-like protein KIN-12C [Cocos nucifera]|uniref:Putative Kinesin-like protein KIN-12C n=1 Tax=Cocos nucifera TaxID=13894 RepID=A0A8K0IWV2_COCNU|nr:putative Kinesin-like protein KIN-12C [Cocos nucifera]
MDQKIPYMDSCLTHLLQETLGGNAKITFICTIFPDDRCKASTLSTLRFGDRAKHIQNKAVINEITEDDVNGLSDQIRQLKEELIRAKSYKGNRIATTGGYFKGHNARESLNLLRVSLNRSLILPRIDINSEEDMDVHEEDVKELCQHLSNLCSSSEDTLEDILENNNSLNVNPSKEGPIGTCSVNQEFNVGFFSAQSRLDEVHSEIFVPPEASNGSAVSAESLVCQNVSSSAGNDQLHSSRKSILSVIPGHPFPILQDPTLCSSPKMNNNLKKIIMSSGFSAEMNNSSETFRKSDLIRSSLQSSKISPTESLATSLHRGLQIIDYHQQNSSAKSSFAGFSFEHLTSVSCKPVDKVDTGMQTLPEDGGISPTFLCSTCKKVVDVNGIKSVNDNSDMQIVPFNKVGTTEDNDKISGSTVTREVELEALCLEQAATIKHLNSLVDEYTKKKEQSSNSEQNRVAMSSTDGVMAIMEHENEDHMLLNHHSKINTEVLKEKKILKELQNDLDCVNNTSFDIRNGDPPSPDKGGDELEKERQRWTESESRWISLTEELRLDLESNRRLAEKKEIELSLEKKSTAELDDALHRAVLGHARIVEHYAELQEKYNDLLERHRKVMEGIAEVKKAAVKAGRKGSGSAFAAALAAELSTVRIDREKERAYLKEQNRKLRIQLRDTADAVHAAGELLVRLREAEETVRVTEEKYGRAQQEVEKLKKQMEKMKRKHTLEMATMKHYFAESRLPKSALEPFYRHESEIEKHRRAPQPDDDQAWRNAFRPSYMLRLTAELAWIPLFPSSEFGIVLFGIILQDDVYQNLLSIHHFLVPDAGVPSVCNNEELKSSLINCSVIIFGTDQNLGLD